jgi:purine-nucleoside phosphorylase
MDTFETLFGITSKAVQRTCVLLPVIAKDTLRTFGIEKLSKGLLYGAANGNGFTIVHTRVGAPFLGDAVLHLGKTDCVNLVLLGACGAVRRTDNLTLGSMVSPHKCYALESFSNLLLDKDSRPLVFYPHGDLYETFLAESKNTERVTCLSAGSLKLQDEWKEQLPCRGVEVVDMECSAFFAAARHTGRRAVALFYVSDIIGEKPFFSAYSAEEKSAVSTAAQRAAENICEFIRKHHNA